MLRHYILFILIALLSYGLYLYYKQPKFKQGITPPNIEGRLLNGEYFNLSHQKNTILLIDFWGSWCGPCRIENKQLKKLWDKWQKRNKRTDIEFQILSLAIEKDSMSWLKAVKKDSLVWPYHIGLMERFNSPLAKLYGIKEIPTKYLISSEGIIISVNPSVEDIDTYLSHYTE